MGLFVLYIMELKPVLTTADVTLYRLCFKVSVNTAGSVTVSRVKDASVYLTPDEDVMLFNPCQYKKQHIKTEIIHHSRDIF